MDKIEEQVIEYMNAKFKWSKDLPLENRTEVVHLYIKTRGAFSNYRDYLLNELIDCRDIYELELKRHKANINDWENEQIEQCIYLSDIYDYMANQNRKFWVETLDIIADEYETVGNVVNEMNDDWLDFKGGVLYVMDDCNEVVFLYDLNDLWDKYVYECSTGELFGLDYYEMVGLV